MSTEERHQYGQADDGEDTAPTHEVNLSAGDVVDHAATPETVEEAGRLVPRSVADEAEHDDP